MMPRPVMPAPAPQSTTPDIGFEYANKTLPVRVLKPGALEPTITLWRSVDGPNTRFLAMVHYGSVQTHVIRPTEQLALAAARQFYMHFTAQGRADSTEKETSSNG